MRKLARQMKSRLFFYMIAMKGQLWDLHLPWQLGKVYLLTRHVIDAINISAESRSFCCHIIDCICESNQMFMAVIALLLLSLCHQGRRLKHSHSRLQVFSFKRLFDTFRLVKRTFAKGKWEMHWSTVVDIQGPLGIQCKSTTTPLVFSESLRPYFLTCCADLINKLQICC